MSCLITVAPHSLEGLHRLKAGSVSAILLLLKVCLHESTCILNMFVHQTTCIITIFCAFQGLLNLGGNSVYTKRIAEHYTDASLCFAWRSAASAMASQAEFGPVWHLALSADQLVCASQMLQDYGSIRSLTVTSLRGPGTVYFHCVKHAGFCANRHAYASQPS